MAKDKNVRSVRTPDEDWAKAQKRAKKAGVSMSHVVGELVEGYANGFIDLPQVTKEYAPASK